MCASVSVVCIYGGSAPLIHSLDEGFDATSLSQTGLISITAQSSTRRRWSTSSSAPCPAGEQSFSLCSWNHHPPEGWCCVRTTLLRDLELVWAKMILTPRWNGSTIKRFTGHRDNVTQINLDMKWASKCGLMWGNKHSGRKRLGELHVLVCEQYLVSSSQLGAATLDFNSLTDVWLWQKWDKRWSVFFPPVLLH